MQSPGSYQASCNLHECYNLRVTVKVWEGVGGRGNFFKFIYIYFFFSKKTLIFFIEDFFFFFLAIQPLLRSRPRSFRAAVLGHGFGALGDSVCGHLPRQPQTHSCLDLPDVRMVQPTSSWCAWPWRRCRWWDAPESAPCTCTLNRLLYTGCAFWTSCPQDSRPSGPPDCCGCPGSALILLLLLLEEILKRGRKLEKSRTFFSSRC